MRTNLSFGQKNIGESTDDYLARSLRAIEEASNEDAFLIADAYSVTNFTETRSLNAGTATLPQVANFIATFIADLQKRSINRAE